MASAFDDPSVLAVDTSAASGVPTQQEGGSVAYGFEGGDVEMPSSQSAFNDPSVVNAVAELDAAEAFFAEGNEASASFVPSRSQGSTSQSNRAGDDLRLRGESTLDEPVVTTLARDLRHIGRKLVTVVVPYRSQANALALLRDWDLWGPLFVCLALAISLSSSATDEQSSLIFSIVFVVVWAGSAIVTLNAQLLGGKISFLQSVCVLGYSVFPILVARVLCILIELAAPRLIVLRIALVVPAWIWATKASVLFISEVISVERRTLAVYPVLGFYAWLSWMVLVV